MDKDKAHDAVVFDEPKEIISSSEFDEDKVLEFAEKRLQSIKRVKEFALTLTNQSNWVDFDGKPYLDAAGCEKVARPFGVKIKLKSPPYEKIIGTDEKGPYYMYIFYGTASLANGADEIDVIGKCSSRDKFFGKAEGELKPLTEVDEPNIMMKAYNNLFMNGVKRLLGLRNMTWVEVKAGTDRSQTSKVPFQSRKAETTKDGQENKNKYIAEIDRLL